MNAHAGLQPTTATLVGDFGGTHARLGLMFSLEDGPQEVQVFESRLFSGAEELIRTYVQETGAVLPEFAALAVASAVTGDQVTLTNSPWSFSRRRLMQALQLKRLVVINDFTALALSLTGLQAQDLTDLGGVPELDPLGPKALIGAGTGLGVSGLLPNGQGGWVPIAGEGGHATVAPNGQLESAVVQALAREFGHVSAERVLSGPGLVNLYEAVCRVNGVRAVSMTPSEVLRLGENREDAACDQALECFCSFLGGAAGNLALTLGATGGIYIGGGIAPRLLSRLAGGGFRRAFEAKGRFSAYLQKIPTRVLDANPAHALRGAACALT
jgi:glucokinase